MGGSLSNFIGKKEDDEEENLRRYQEKIDGDGTLGFSDDLDKQKVRWWEWILFHKQLRILYAVLLALGIGIIIPFIIFFTLLDSNDSTIYGSCLIKDEARFECLINSAKIADKETCQEALCCWEESRDDIFNCYHSFPSAYQYNVSNTKVDIVDGTEWTTIQTIVTQKNKMSYLEVLTHWESDSHLVIELFNPSKFPGRSPPKNVKDETKSTTNGSSASRMQTNPLSVSWGKEHELFYIRIGRNETDETIFDTRIGPVISAEDYITLSTILPTSYFLGLKGGERSTLSTVKYGTVNGFESAELPFYMAFEKSGKWHGVLLDTNVPMMTQVFQAQGIMFHLETESPEINLHVFAGPTQADIVSQLYSYLRTKDGINHPPMIPPYWGLGLHLCRRADNDSVVLKDLQFLLQERKHIPFDSDCIEEYLRHPFVVDKARFENLTEIISLLDAKSKKIVLSQKVTQQWDDEDDIIDDAWLMDRSNITEVVHFHGQVENITVRFIDFLNPKLTEFPLPTDIRYNGISLSGNTPRLDNASEICSEPKTSLQSLFSFPENSTSSNSSYFWGSVCPEVVHTLGTESTGLPKYSTHFSLHNTYGHESLKKVHETLNNLSLAQDTLLTTSSIWTSSMFYGGFNGLQVPFTWQGLRDSIGYVIRNYALSPVPATPICGSMIFNMSIPQNDDLCLRWFQFGLLLPIARNSYDGKSAYGPVHFSDLHRGYLNESILARYTYAPYYYTNLNKFQSTCIPMIRPMSFHFNDENIKDMTLLSILDQFMIGEAVLAAPIIDRGVTRQTYFPAGIWYNMDGEIASNRNKPSLQQMTGFIHETPMFLRGGYIIPTLQNPQVTSIDESRGGNYSLMIALSSLTNPSVGMLTVKGKSTSHHLDFEAILDANNTLTVTVISSTPETCITDELDSTIIDQLRIFGYPVIGLLQITVEPTDTAGNITYRYHGEHNALRISNLNLDWCAKDKYLTSVKLKPKSADTS